MVDIAATEGDMVQMVAGVTLMPPHMVGQTEQRLSPETPEETLCGIAARPRMVPGTVLRTVQGQVDLAE